MTKPRKQQIVLEATSYYHCVSRCVRRAYLCGSDFSTGHCYEHRRQWVEDKMLALADVFSLDVCAFAVMSNHYHVVFHINKEKAKSWTQYEVIERWHRLYKGNPLSQRFLQGQSMEQEELGLLKDLTENWRQRLVSISQFMQILNESIARQANAEDGCTGRFWEGRYKSQALLDDAALAACMTYVDLNPIRAGVARSPETALHTSVQKRIQYAKKVISPNQPNQQPSSLMPFVGNSGQELTYGLPFQLKDYLELIDWTGRMVREDKHGVIAQKMPAILERLAIEPKHWLYCSTEFESRFKGWVGRAYKLKQVCSVLSIGHIPGVSACQQLFG